MKNRILFILAALLTPLFLLGARVPVHAAYDPFGKVCQASDVSTGEDASTVCVDKNPTGSGNPIWGPDGIILRAASLLTYIIGIASTIIVIYGGLKYILANGDANSVDNAKNTILYALIGVVVAVVSRGIILFVINNI